jgi:hypothetical protein
MGLKSFLNRVFPGRPPLYPAGEEWKATRDEIRRIASPCPVCNQIDLSEHQFGLFASQIAATTSPELEKFIELYRARCWRDLNSIRGFEGRFNAVILYALFCPRGVCMLMVRDPVELYDSNELLEMTLLGKEEAVEIKSLQIETHDL